MVGWVGRARRRAAWLVVSMVALAVTLAACGDSSVRVVSFSPPASPVSAHRPVASPPPVATSTSIAHLPAPRSPGATGVVIDHGPGTAKVIALTFDSNLTDGMLGELDGHKVASFYNQRVVDELDQLQVPATFFLSGLWMERYPDAVRRLAADPLFELGSHSYAHKAFHLPCFGLGGLRVGEMAADVSRSEDVLRRFTAQPTAYFRFPGLCYDQAALRAVAGTGVVVIGGDVPGGDAFSRSVPAIVHQTLSHAHPGAIVVLHVTGGNTAPLTADALPQIVDGLRKQGYALVKVSDLLAAPAS